MVRDLHNLRSDPSNNSNTHLAPYIIITILLTLLPMLYFIFLWLFCNYQFVLLNPFSFSPPPSNTLPIWQLSDCSIYASVFVLFVHLFCSLDSIYKWNHMVFVFLCLFFNFKETKIENYRWWNMSTVCSRKIRQNSNLNNPTHNKEPRFGPTLKD